MEYLVVLEEGVYIAPWDGDPGRTLKKENAEIFKTKPAAHKALEAAQTYRTFNTAKVDDLQ